MSFDTEGFREGMTHAIAKSDQFNAELRSNTDLQREIIALAEEVTWLARLMRATGAPRHNTIGFLTGIMHSCVDQAYGVVTPGE